MSCGDHAGDGDTNLPTTEDLWPVEEIGEHDAEGPWTRA